MNTLLASFTTKEGEIVEVYVTTTHYYYTVFSGPKLVQKNLTANDCIRYLAHRLEQK